MNYKAKITKTLLQHILHQHRRRGRSAGESNTSKTQLTEKSVLQICFEKKKKTLQEGIYMITLDKLIIKYAIHEILFMLNGKGSAYLTNS